MSKAGYTCLIRRSGNSTAALTEPLAVVTSTSNLTFQISAAAKRALDPLVNFHFKEGTTTIAFSEIASMNWEFGEVTFTASHTTSSVSFSGSFYPLSTTAEVVTEAKSFTLSESSDLLDKTVFTSTSRFVKRIYGLADATVSVDILVNVTDAPKLATIQSQGAMMMLEINSGFSALFRGYGKIESLERSGGVEGLVEFTLNWSLAAERHAETSLIAGYSIRNFAS